MRKHFILVNENVKQYAIQQIQSLPIDADKPLVIEVKEKTRSLDQNAKLWATLTDISEQIEWYGKKFNPEDWKHIFSASIPNTTLWIKRLKIREKTREAMNR